jgi:nitroreductase
LIKKLIQKNRSYRRFDQSKLVDKALLRDLVDLARLSPSAANLQPLKYILNNDVEENKKIFPTLSWAGYLRSWPGPMEGERPAAYIIILGDTAIKKSINCDHGIATQSILLGAVEKGLGGCIIASIKRDELRDILSIPDRFEILLVIALGVPKEEVKLEPIGPDGSIEYWRDKDEIHHVPKRTLDEIILE